MAFAQGSVILELVLNGASDLVQEVSVVVPAKNSNHNVIKFSIHVSGRLPNMVEIVTFHFKRWNFTK